MDDYENKLFDEDVLIKTPVMLKRRTRSASVDDIKSYKTKASLRSSSEKNSSNDGVKTYSKKSKDRTLPAIIEENQEKPYSDSRRLTRLQASMLKENEAKTKPLKQEDNEKVPHHLNKKIVDKLEPVRWLLMCRENRNVQWKIVRLEQDPNRRLVRVMKNRW